VKDAHVRIIGVGTLGPPSRYPGMMRPKDIGRFGGSPRARRSAFVPGSYADTIKPLKKSTSKTAANLRTIDERQETQCRFFAHL